MSPRLRAGLIIAEVVVCFALPAYTLFWGIVSAPLFYFAWMRGGTYAAWTLAETFAGCLGVVAAVACVRYVVSARTKRGFAAIRNIVFALTGVTAIWSTATAQFQFFDLNVFTIVLAVV